MLNFYGRKHSRKLKNYQIQDIKNFSFFFEKEKIKTLKEIKKNFEKFNLEIGFGFGENLLNQSLKFKNEFFLGCDPYIKGSINLKKKILFFNLNNLFLTNLDFFDLLKQVDFFFFNKITILFPDHWPKKKHKKRRLINEKFVKLLSKISHEKTKIIVSTDHKDYLRQILYEFHD